LLLIEPEDRFLEEREAFGGDLAIARAHQAYKFGEELLRCDAPPAICR
jgi:hypothetical protein